MATVKTKTEKKITKAEPAGNVHIDSKSVFIIKQPWITEKSYNASLGGKYVFLVDKHTNKSEVKKAVEALYKVSVVSVNTVNFRGKTKHFGSNITPASKYKKAVVTLKQGQKIDVMPT